MVIILSSAAMVWYKIDNVEPCPTCNHVRVRNLQSDSQMVRPLPSLACLSARSMKVPAAFFALFHDKSPYLKVMFILESGSENKSTHCRFGSRLFRGLETSNRSKAKTFVWPKKRQDSSCFSWNQKCLGTEHLWKLLLKWNRDTLPLHFSITNRCHLPSSGLSHPGYGNNCYDTRMVYIHWYGRWKAILDLITTTKPGKLQLLWLKFMETRRCVSRSQTIRLFICVTVCT